jgi:hypothetical protein
MIQAKLGLNWPSGFRGEDFWKGLQTDDGRQVMAIAHTGELKKPSDGRRISDYFRLWIKSAISGCACAHPTQRNTLRGHLMFDDVTSGSHATFGHAHWYILYYYYSRFAITRVIVLESSYLFLTEGMFTSGYITKERHKKFLKNWKNYVFLFK